MKAFIFNDITGLLSLNSVGLLPVIAAQNAELLVANNQINDYGNASRSIIIRLLDNSILKEAEVDSGLFPYYNEKKKQWRGLGYGDISTLYHAHCTDATLITRCKLIQSVAQSERIEHADIEGLVRTFIKDEKMIEFISRLKAA